MPRPSGQESRIHSDASLPYTAVVPEGATASASGVADDEHATVSVVTSTAEITLTVTVEDGETTKTYTVTLS